MKETVCCIHLISVNSIPKFYKVAQEDTKYELVYSLTLLCVATCTPPISPSVSRETEK